MKLKLRLKMKSQEIGKSPERIRRRPLCIMLPPSLTLISPRKEDRGRPAIIGVSRDEFGPGDPTSPFPLWRQLVSCASKRMTKCCVRLWDRAGSTCQN